MKHDDIPAWALNLYFHNDDIPTTGDVLHYKKDAISKNEYCIISQLVARFLGLA